MYATGISESENAMQRIVGRSGVNDAPVSMVAVLG